MRPRARRAGRARSRAAATTGAPTISASPWGTSTATLGSAGKSSSIAPSTQRVAVSSPLAVRKRAGSVGATRPVSQRTWALASVACPHSATSTVGVNHRSSSSAPSPSPFTGVVTTNAVSERFISAATACIHCSSAGASRRHTAAGLPRNASLVNASTPQIGRGEHGAGAPAAVIRSPPGRRRCPRCRRPVRGSP